MIGDSRQSNVAAGNDTIIISGTVTGNVIGDSSTQTIAVPGGNDTIILQDGANGGSDNRLIIIGLIGYDTLVFQFTVNSKAEYQALSDLIAAANPNDGSIVINGQTYRWIQMEELKNALIKGYIVVVPSPASPDTVVLAEPSDGRINWEDRGFAPVAVYCWDNVVQVYSHTGWLIFMSNAESIIAALPASDDVNQRVDGSDGFSLWTLNQTAELQIHADDGSYDYIFPVDCLTSTR